MKVFILLALFAAVYCAPTDLDVDRMWKEYKEIFQKEYRDEVEHKKRRDIFESNLQRIVTHNLDADFGKHSFHLGLNHLADMTAAEVKATLNGYAGRKSSGNDIFIPPADFVLPETVDWRNQGLVTGVKNQEQCGSCWAFSTTGSLEGQHKKKTGQLVSLSEQNLMDCSRAEGNNGCEGGLMDNAFAYIKKNGGIDTEASYPYEAQDDTCRFKRDSVGATLVGYKDIPTGDEAALQKAAAAVGPISVAIDASQSSFQLYSGGVYDEENCSSTALDHGVLVVGYGSENGKDYWLVKNSWGEQWGEDGYIKMSRNRNNQCGIATQASFPLV